MINLTIQSLNNKTITAVSLSNNSLLSTFNQSVSTSLPYDNILVKVHTADTFTMGNLAAVLHKVPDNYVFGFILVLLIACTLGILYLAKAFKR